MSVDVERLVLDLDLPELVSMSKEELATDFVPAAVAGLSDGDITVIHPEPHTDAEKIRLYGEHVFNHGLVAQRVAEAAIATANNPSAVYDFQGFTADYCSSPFSAFYDNDMTEQNIRVHSEVLEIDDNIVALRQPPNVVVDYTACLSSRSLVRDQLGFLQTDHRPFAYIAIARMHFTNLMLMQSYERQVGPGTANLMIGNHLYTGREDGIASATNEIISAQTAGGGPVQIADVILCNGGQHSTREDLKTGAENAYTIIQDEGLFVIRAFAKPSTDEIGTDEIADWAFEVGFKEQTALEYSAVSHSVGAAVLRPQDTHRLMKTLVLTK